MNDDELKKVFDQITDDPEAYLSSLNPRYVPLTAIQSRRQRFLWRGFIPQGQLSLSVGDKSLGKSTFCIWLAARVTRGQLPGDMDGIPGNVVYCSAEDDARCQIKGRAAVADADLDRLFVLNPEGPGFDLQAILQHEPVLAIFDPISAYTKLATGQEHAEGEVRHEMDPYRVLAQKHNIAMHCVRHPHKGTETGSPFDAVLGSRAWADLSRMVIFFAKDEDEERQTLGLTVGIIHPKGNLAPPHPGLKYHIDREITVLDDGEADEMPKFVLDEDLEVEYTLEQSMGAQPKEPSVSPRSVAKLFLRQALHNGPEKAADLEAQAKDWGISHATLQRAANDLGIIKQDGWWKLPDE